MLYSKEALIELVKVNMEEGVAPFDSEGAEQIEGYSIANYIESKLPEAINKIFCAAPLYLLSHHSAKDILTPRKNQNGSGEIILPKDMLLLSLLKMRGWERSVTRFYPEDSEVALLQNNPYTMAGKAKPVAVLCCAANGERMVKYYSLPPEVINHEIEEALYVKVPDLSLPIDINELLVPSITYLTASMVFEIMGEPEQAAIMKSNVSII